MERTGWQRNWVRIVTTLLTAAVMVMIFCFSTENADESNERSGFFSGVLVRLIHPDFEQMDPAQQQTAFDDAQVIVRKCAHFTEYAMLGFLIRLCLESWFGHRARKSRSLFLAGLAGGAAYACTDEAHQLAVAGRYGEWTDVLVDSGGVLAGAAAASLLIRLTERRRAEKHNAEE